MRRNINFLFLLIGMASFASSADATVASADGVVSPSTCFPQRGQRSSQGNIISSGHLQKTSILHVPLNLVEGGCPVEIVVTVLDPPPKFDVSLHYRRRGEGIYYSQPFKPAGESTYGSTIPDFMVDSREGVEYYIEVTDESRRKVASSGTSDVPHGVAIRPERGGYLGLLLLAASAVAILTLVRGRDQAKRDRSSLRSLRHKVHEI